MAEEFPLVFAVLVDVLAGFAGSLLAVSPVLAASVFAGSAFVESVLVSVVSVFSSLVVAALVDLRLSVTYQPEPLNTIPTGWNTRRTALAQDGHVRIGSSLNDWNCSNCAPHESHL